ncbi:hypothetical protein [Methanosarcina mazei]|nr:hypothetical protein [Methanosarcina mazei]MDY0246215.1 hypothetical protein [Methanosarcina mazei]
MKDRHMVMDKKDFEQISNSKARKEMEKLQKKASSGDKAAKKMLEKEIKRK